MEQLQTVIIDQEQVEYERMMMKRLDNALRLIAAMSLANQALQKERDELKHRLEGLEK